MRYLFSFIIVEVIIIVIAAFLGKVSIVLDFLFALLFGGINAAVHLELYFK